MPRTGLTKAAVVDAAVALADEAGADVTLAALAARLGVRTPSLYHHVAGQDGLRRELALRGLRLLAQRLGRAAVGKAGDAAVVALGCAYRAFAHEHPGLYAATLRAPTAADAELVAASAEVVDIALAVLAGYGVADAAALHAVRGLRSALHGFVTLEAAGGFGLPLDLDESFRRLLQTFIAGLRQGAGG